MKLTMMECLKGMAHEMCWGIRDAVQRINNFNRYAFYGLKAVTRKPRLFVEKLCQQSFAHIDEQLSKKGTPRELRKAAGFVLMLPAIAVRVALVGIVIALWVWHAPQVAVRVWTSVAAADQYPNKKGTPKKSRPWQRLDDFDDVRARIRELSYPKH